MVTEKKDGLRGRIALLETKVSDMARELRRVSSLLRIKDNWHSEVHEWLGKPVHIKLVNGVEYNGELKWTDKYHLAIRLGKDDSHSVYRTLVINKGAVASIEPIESEGSSW